MSSTKATDGATRARIRRLSEALIDQIAAGEVVERPASVVKELVENALDAGAGRVRVEVRAGGRDWIAVADDGCGMAPGDARLALERHATSKLGTVDDLQRIATFGFRGEALPAIASVSRLRLRTRSRDAAEAFEIRVDAGRVGEGLASAGPVGTRVEVADLFAAVPARRKFLKTPTTEWGHVADWLGRAALSLPDVHFDVQRDDRPAIAWPAAGDPLDRVAAVLGEAEAAALVPLARSEGALGVEGFASRPDRHRANAGGIHLFVNRRPVRDRLLRHALLEVYRDLLPRGRFPHAVLFVGVPPEAVDVNVHPAKWEVRFADPPAVHQLLRRALREAIAQRSWVAGAAPELALRGGAREAGARTAGPGLSSPGGAAAGPRIGGPTPGPDAPVPPRSQSDWIFAAAVRSDAGTPPPPFRLADQRLLGQLLGTYLVLEAKEQLLLVDQHAAHERVLFERLRAEWTGRGVECQSLLIPLTLELDPQRLAALAEAADSVRRLGFELEPFGQGALAVRAVPALLAERDPAELVRGLADELAGAEGAGDAARVGSRALEAADRVFASLACHAARRKGEWIEEREQRALMDALDGIPWAPTCPHGRPVVVPFELAEIERRFARR